MSDESEIHDTSHQGELTGDWRRRHVLDSDL